MPKEEAGDGGSCTPECDDGVSSGDDSGTDCSNCNGPGLPAKSGECFNVQCVSGQTGRPDYWIRSAAIASALAAIIGLGLIYMQLRASASQHKKERSFLFADRYYDPNYVDEFIASKRFVTAPDFSWDTFMQNADARKAIGITINYFEELGALYRRDLVDKVIIDDLLSDVCIQSYDQYSGIIKELRDRQREDNPDITDEDLCYKSWELMKDDLVQKNRKP